IASFAAQGAGPINLAVSPDGARLYVVNFTSNTVTVFRTSDNALMTSINVAGSSALHVTFSSDGTFAYVTSGNSSTLAQIDTTSLTVTATPTFAGTNHATAISPDG